MKINILSNKKDKIVFEVEGISVAFANSMRRIMMSEVPTMAIEWAEISENNSALFDEIIAHRLGLLPIVFDPKKFSFPEDNEKITPTTHVVFVAEKTGPGVLYSGDLKSSNKEVKFTDARFPIVELLKNHKIKFEAVAHMGIGLDHSKFQAAIASYQYYPEIEVSKGVDPVKAMKSLPKDVFVLNGNKIEIADPVLAEKRGFIGEVTEGVTVRWNPNKFIFTVESVSGLSPEYIVDKACEILQEKADEFERKLNKI